MPRPILDEDHIHPAVRDKVAGSHADVVQEVRDAVAGNALVVVGMAGNPFCRRARKLLASRGLTFEYLEYGSYFSQWRRRNALKMWTGWPTLPMVFAGGMLVGGSSDLERLIDGGELSALMERGSVPSASEARPVARACPVSGNLAGSDRSAWHMGETVPAAGRRCTDGACR